MEMIEGKMRKIEILISGRVQGVSFRFFTLQKAIALGIKGYVQNTYEGKVKVIAVGDIDAMDIFLSELHNGPRMSNVERLEIVELASTAIYENFRIKH